MKIYTDQNRVKQEIKYGIMFNKEIIDSFIKETIRVE